MTKDVYVNSMNCQQNFSRNCTIYGTVLYKLQPGVRYQVWVNNSAFPCTLEFFLPKLTWWPCLLNGNDLLRQMSLKVIQNAVFNCKIPFKMHFLFLQQKCIVDWFCEWYFVVKNSILNAFQQKLHFEWYLAVQNSLQNFEWFLCKNATLSFKVDIFVVKSEQCR